MNKKQHYRTVFISDIHLWNPKNQWDKLIKFLNLIDFENLIIVWDFIDFWKLRRFWKRWEKEKETLNYINNLAKSWIKITYIQWNHDRKLKYSEKIKIENMTICKEMYYKTLKWKIYYITHWDSISWNSEKLSDFIWQLWNLIFWCLSKLEKLWNKKSSLTEKLENYIKKMIVPDHKIKKKIENFTKNLTCDWIIIWHFHIAEHYEVNWIDYFCTWDRIKNCSAVIEDLKWNLELIKI